MKDPTSKLMSVLPDWKTLILRSIDSCTNKNQLSVAWHFIQLFQTRYEKIVTPLELHGHAKQLLDAYCAKDSALTLHQVN